MSYYVATPVVRHFLDATAFQDQVQPFRSVGTICYLYLVSYDIVSSGLRLQPMTRREIDHTVFS